MSGPNADLVRRSFEAHAKGGIEAALVFYAADFAWYPGPGWLEDSVYRGHEGARRLDAVFLENFDDYTLEVHEIRPVADRVLALYEATGHIRGSGAPVRQQIGLVMSDFRDGTIGAVRSFFSWKEAVDYMGLAE
jgi:ketosteroid isomerase-like protein